MISIDERLREVGGSCMFAQMEAARQSRQIFLGSENIISFSLPRQNEIMRIMVTSFVSTAETSWRS